ncbi:MAG TPA: hypothetical protein VF079_08085 [Sphingomicrobium sp.]
MDNDAVRSSGDRTIVDMWIDGKFRSISVTRAAIEAHLGLSDERAEEMTDDDRREFVRANLKLLAAVAADWVRENDLDAATVLLERISGKVAEPRQDRRQSDRRKGGDRRKMNLGPPSTGERRRGGDPRGA